MNKDFNAFVAPGAGDKLIRCEDSLNSNQGESFPIVRNIPRFVGKENYSDDFGAQWNRFPKTQLDSQTGLKNTEDRLARCLGGELTVLAGKLVLEAGSGAGRFTEVLLKHGAIVHSFDYSTAVEANALNNGHSANLTLAQADIRRIPYQALAYDYVVCLGVLQHTPKPEESVRCLWNMVKPGGTLVIDHYIWKWRNILPPPIGVAESVYRQIILRLPKSKRFRAVKAITDFWFPLHWLLKDIRFAQQIMRRVSPVHFYYPHYKLRDRKMYYEWALLDTHDGTTDYYKHHRSPNQIRQLLESEGAVDIQVAVAGNGVEARCRKAG